MKRLFTMILLTVLLIASVGHATVIGGDENLSLAPNGIVGGYRSVASGPAAFAIGDFVAATAHAASATGHSTVSSAEAAHAEGWNNYARARYSHVEGASNATGSSATDTEALGAHAEGVGNIAGGGIGAHAEGYIGVANGNGAHSEGVWAHAMQPASHAEGEDTWASGWRGHAEGAWSEARGIASHSEGQATLAIGNSSSAHGDSAIALRETQWTLAGGNFDNDSNASTLPPPAKGHAQTSTLVLRAQTPGLAPNENALFKFGSYGNVHFTIAPGRAYWLRARALMTSPTATARSALELLVTGTTLDIISSTSTADWTLSVSLFDSVLWWRIATTCVRRTNAVLILDFDEVVTP